MLKDDMTILTPTEVQDYLMVGKNEVYRLLGEGEIKRFRMGVTGYCHAINAGIIRDKEKADARVGASVDLLYWHG